MFGFERLFGFGLGALVLATVVGCAADVGETEEDSATSSQSIIGGRRASDYPEAALINGDGFVCSGSLVAPRVVLTAGHCIVSSSYVVKAPFVNKTAAGTRVWTDYRPTGELVNPNTLDVGVIIIDPPIELASYPELTSRRVATGTTVVNVGRIDNGSTSWTALYVGRPVAVSDAAPSFPKAYYSADIIQPGDSGGPAYAGSGDSRTIVAVNSGVQGSTQVLARVDLAYDKIKRLIAQNP